MLESNTTTPTPSASSSSFQESLPPSMQLASMTVCVAAFSHSTPETIEWRDVWCHDCDKGECMEGTAAQLAEKVLALDWIVESVKNFDVLCAVCREDH